MFNTFYFVALEKLWSTEAVICQLKNSIAQPCYDRPCCALEGQLHFNISMALTLIWQFMTLQSKLAMLSNIICIFKTMEEKQHIKYLYAGQKSCLITHISQKFPVLHIAKKKKKNKKLRNSRSSLRQLLYLYDRFYILIRKFSSTLNEGSVTKAWYSSTWSHHHQCFHYGKHNYKS